MAPHVLILYDGVCGLCHGLVQALIRHDGADTLRYAPLQGPTAAAILARHAKNAADLDTVYCVENWGQPDERLSQRSAALLAALGALGNPWPWFAAVLKVWPTAILDWGYRQVARRRYRLFGCYAACFVPTPQQRHKFLA